MPNITVVVITFYGLNCKIVKYPITIYLIAGMPGLPFYLQS